MGWHRHPRTTQERRAATALVADAEAEELHTVHTPRPRRNGKLPHAWCDLKVAARTDRSWKRFRERRWKIRKN